MADESENQSSKDPLALLKEIREGKTPTPVEPLNFAGANLAGEDLSGMDLSGANFSGADLTGVNLSQARLFKANFQKAMLHEANLEGTEMSGADLSEAILEEVNAKRVGLGMACLRGARLFNANLENATLSLANLENADLRSCCLRNARMRETHLTGTDLTSADMHGVDMALSHVEYAIFNNANMRETRLRLVKGFEKAQWIGVDIRDVNFAGAYRLRRFVVDQNYIKEFRMTNRLTAGLYYLWWISSDCGRSLSRWCLWIVVQVFLFAFLYTFVNIDYGDHPTWFSSVYYSVVTLTTLGYGDAVPASFGGQLLAMAEVIIGYVMLGGLLAILSNKLARRAD